MSRSAGTRSIERAMSRMDAAGNVVVLGRDRTARDRKAALFSLPADRAEEPRLADARLAREQQELAVAGRDVFDASVHEVEQFVAPDEERATNDAQGT